MKKPPIIKRSRFFDFWIPFQLVLIPVFVLGAGIPFLLDLGLNFFTVGWFLIGIYLFVHQIIVIKVYFTEGQLDPTKFYKMEGIARKLRRNKFLAKYIIDPDQK